MDQGGAGQPGDQRSVFDGIPTPVAAPAEFFIGPRGAPEDAAAEGGPGKNDPRPRLFRPGVVEPAAQQGGYGQSKGYTPGGIAEEDDRRMDQHGRVLQERRETVARSASHQGRLHGIGGEDHDGHEETEIRHECAEGQVAKLMPSPAGGKTVDDRQHRHKPRPKQQRAPLADPKRGKRIVPGQQGVGILRDILKTEVLDDQRLGQQHDGRSQGQDAGRRGPDAAAHDARGPPRPPIMQAKAA